MDSNSFERDIEHESSTKMAQKPLVKKDGRKKVLVIGAGAAGYGSLQVSGRG